MRILDNRAAHIKTFLGGPSRGGGIYMSSGTLVLVNGLMSGNDGEYGSALWVHPGNVIESMVSMNYVTLADN